MMTRVDDGKCLLRFSQPIIMHRLIAWSLLASLGSCLPALNALAQDPVAKSATLLGKVKQVFVPVDDLEPVIFRDQRGVMMPRSEFLTLLNKAKARDEAAPSSVGIVLSRAEYEARVSGDQLIVTARLDLSQFDAGWHVLSLPFRGMGVESAAWGDQPARLGRSTKSSTLQFLNDQPGRRTLQLELSTPLVSAGSDKIAAFGVPRSASATLKIALPKGKHLLIDELTVEAPAGVTNSSSLEIPVGGRDEIRLRITDHETRQASAGMVFASTVYSVDVSPGTVDWRAETNVEVFGKPLDRLRFAVPKSLEIVDVDSSGLESWELADDAADASRTSITLTYRQSFQDSRRITFRGVTPVQSGDRWAVPPLILASAASHVGHLVVSHPADVRLRTEQAMGVRSVSAPSVIDETSRMRLPEGAPAAASSKMYFDVWREDFQITFVTEPKRSEIYADILTSLDLPETGLELSVAAKIETVYAPLFELDLSLPAEWIIAAVTLDGQPANWRSTAKEAGLHSVTVPLKTPLAPGKEVSLVLTARRDLETWPVTEQGVELPLPEVRIPSAGVVVGSYVVKADEDLELTPLDVTGLDPAHLQIARERLGYRYQDTRFSGKLRLSRKPARLSVETLSFSRLEKDALRTHLELRLEAGGGGLRQTEILLPESTGTNVRFVVPDEQARILEQRASNPANGERRWTLRFDRLIKGSLLLAVDLQLPRGDLLEYQPPAARVTTADRQTGYIIVEGEPDQRLALVAAGPDNRPLTEVDPVDLPKGHYQPRNRIVGAFRYTTPGYRLAVSEERFARLGVPSAVCRECRITSLLGHTGHIQHQAAFRLAAVGVQSVRIVLPESAELWSTLIDGAAVEARRVEGASIVSLPTPARPDAERVLSLTYLTQSPPLSAVGRIQQQTPQLSVITGGGEEQPLEILDRVWTISYPRETSLLQSDGRFHPDGDMDRTSLLGRFGQSFAIPSTQQFLWSLLWLAIASGVVVLFVRSYQRRQFKGIGLASVAVMFCLLIALVLLMLPAVQSAREAAHHPGAKKSEPLPTGSVRSLAAARNLGEKSAPAAGFGEMPAKPSAVEMRDQGRGDVPAPKSEPEPQAGVPILNKIPNDSRLLRGKSAKAGGEKKNDLDELMFGGAVPPSDSKSGEQSGPTKQFDGKDSQAGAKSLLGININMMGRLSVAIDLDVQGDRQQKTFHDRGANIAGGSPELNLLYEDRTAGAAYRLALAAAIVCVMWFLRHRSRRLRVVLGAWGLIGPLALVPVTPVGWHIWLDGIFLGTFGGLALWLVVTCTQSASRFWARVRPAATVAQTTAALLLATAIFTAGRPLSAADETKPAPNTALQQAPNAAANAVDRPVRPAATAMAANAKPAEVSSENDIESGDIRVIVPYDPKGDPLSAERVYIPHDAFLKLWNRAYPEKRIGDRAPLDGTVAGAIYSAEYKPAARDDRPRVAVTARFVVCNFRDHQITLPLPLAQVAVRVAKLDGENAPLAAQDKNGKRAEGEPLRVVLDKPGTHLLDLEFDVPVEVMGPAGRFTLSLMPVATGRLSFVLPAAKLTARVNGSSSVFRLSNDGERDKMDLPIDAGGNVIVSWQPAEERGGVETTVHAEGSQLVYITDAGVKLTSGYTFRVRQGSLTEVVFRLPPEVSLQRLSGPDVGGWEIAGEGAERKLRVFLRRSVNDESRLLFELYQSLKVGDGDVPLNFPAFTPIGVTRETGSVAVFAGPQLRVQSAIATGVARINANEFAAPKDLKLPKPHPDLAYQYSSRPIQLQWQVSREKPESNAAAEHGVIVERRKLRMASRMDVTLVGAPRSRVGITLPADYLPLDVAAAELADWFVGPVQGDAKTLVLEFKSPRLGATRILLDGSVAKGVDVESVSIAVPTLQGLNRLTTHLAVWIDDSYTATIADPAGWKSAKPDELSGDAKQLAKRPPQFAFRSTETLPGPVALKLARLTARLSADVLALVNVTETAVHHTLALKWKIAQGAADTFVFTTPEWLGGRLEFPDSGLRQVTQAKLPDGRVRWTLTREDPVRDQFFLTAIAALPSPASDEIFAPRVMFEEPAAGEGGGYSPLAMQRQYVVLVNQSESQLSAATPGAFQTVESKDLPIRIRPDLLLQATEAVSLRATDQPPTWRRQRLARLGGAAASVNLADLLTVVEPDGSWRTRLVCRVKNRSRQFLALRLPTESNLLSVFVADQPARPVTTTRNEQTLHLLALPKTSDADLSFTVEAVIAGRLDNGNLPRHLQITRSNMLLPVPDIISPQADPEYGIPVVRTKWTVCFPSEQDVEIVETDTNLSQLESGEERLLDLEAALSDASSLLSVLKETGSGRAKYEALGNLKKLEGKYLSGYDESLESRGQLASEVAQRRSQVLSDIRKNEAQIRVNEDNQTAVSVNGMLPSQEFDVAFQLKQALEFNSDNREVNGKGVAQTEKPGENGRDMFRFGREGEELSIKNDFADKEKSSDAKLSAKRNLSQRREKGSQQLQLNEELERQKVQTNAPAQAKPADAPVDAARKSGDTAVPQMKRKIQQSQKGPQRSSGTVAPSVGMSGKSSKWSSSTTGGEGGGRIAPFSALEDLGGEDGVEADFAGKPLAAGGLSLRVGLEPPAGSQKLVFSKPGGSPRLSVAVRPKEALQTGLGTLWALVWLVLGAGLVAAFGGASARPDVRRHLPKVVSAVGLVSFLMLPMPLNGLGLAVFVVGLAIALRRQQIGA